MHTSTMTIRPRRIWMAVPIAMGTLAFTAACGSSGGTSTAALSGSMSSPTATAAVVADARTGLGPTLVDGRGRTVYEFANDTGSASTCTGDCANDWPPVVAPDTLPAAPPDGVTGALGSTTRSDGTKQLTVAGHPVYTYEGDDAPGQTNGDGITLNGGIWHAVSPTGSPVSSSSSSSSRTGY